MNQIITIVKILMIRISEESPKTFAVIKEISIVLIVTIAGILWLNNFYEWGLGLYLIAKIPLTHLLSAFAMFLAGTFGTSIITVKDTSKIENIKNSKQ